MNLQTLILDLIPASGCSLKALRLALHRDYPECTDAAIDHCLVGLRAVHKIHVLGGTVTVMGKLIDTPKAEIKRTPEQIAAQREAVARWKAANPDKVRAQRVKQDSERKSRRERVVARGNYTAERLRQIAAGEA